MGTPDALGHEELEGEGSALPEGSALDGAADAEDAWLLEGKPLVPGKGEEERMALLEETGDGEGDPVCDAQVLAHALAEAMEEGLGLCEGAVETLTEDDTAGDAVGDVHKMVRAPLAPLE